MAKKKKASKQDGGNTLGGIAESLGSLLGSAEKQWRAWEGPRNAVVKAVTDGLIAELARHPAVEVASRTSVMPFRDRRVPLATIATALSVQAVVEGRIQVTGSRLWVEVRLVDAKRDRKIWVDDFAGDTSDRRALERRIAAALARVLTDRFASGVE